MACFLCHTMSVALVRVALGETGVDVCWACLSGTNFWHELGGVVVWRSPAEPVGQAPDPGAPGGIIPRLR